MLIGSIQRRSVLALLGSTGLLAACGGAKRQEGMSTTLMIARSLDNSNLDPAFDASFADDSVRELAYERLVAQVFRDGAPTGEFQGVLAESWEMEPSGLVWTFKLRRDRMFDDGAPVTAQAFDFSHRRALTVQPGLGANFFWLKGYEVVDDYTLRFTLHEPFPILLHFLSLAGAVVNPAVMAHETDGDMAAAWLSENTAGSGPYRVERWDRGQQLAMGPNPHYATPPEFFERIVFRYIKEPNARRLELTNGRVDICEGLSVDDLERFEAIPDVTVFSEPGAQLVFVDMNNRHPDLSDARVRRALSMAVDYEQLIASVMHGHATPLRGPIPAGMPGFDPGAAIPARDVEGAKALLAEAGRENLEFTLTYVQGGGGIASTALMLQSNMADIGVKLNLEAVAPSAAISKIMGGEYELAMNNFAPAFADPWLVMFPLYFSANAGAGGNTVFYENAKVDALLLQAQSEMDADKRLSLYRDAQKLIVADAPRIFLFSVDGFLAYRDDVGGLNYSAWRPFVYNVASMTRLSV